MAGYECRGSETMNIILIIQARMGSSRLPGKILNPLGESDVLTYVTDRCKQIKGVSEVIVATSILPQDDFVAAWCSEKGITCFRGSERDVLDRYVQCAKQFNPDYVMRVTADCPFVDYKLASDIVQFMKANPVDIIDLQGNMPRGLAVELISYEALKRIHKSGQEERHREHVTYYAYEFREEFSRVNYHVPDNCLYPELRITIDTIEDYQLCESIASHFKDSLVSSVDVIDFLLENPQVAKLNAHIEQKPVV